MIILLAYLFYFVAASASPLQRRWLATKRDGGGQIAFAFQTMAIVAIFGLGLLFFFPFAITGSVARLIALAFVAGFCGAGFFVFSYSAQKHVDAGLTTLLMNVYTPVTIIIATIFLHEGLRPLQIIGALLLFISILLISKKHRLGRFRFDKYFWMMLFSGVLLGVALSAERALMKTTGFAAGTLISWWAQAISLGVAALIFKSHTTYTVRESVITGALKFLQALSWVLLLLVIGNLSVVSAVTTFKVVVIFVAAALLLNERDDLPRKIFGSVVALAGLLLMK
ncbi:MAG: DMT family transporter [Patescibacteria group bacterium]